MSLWAWWVVVGSEVRWVSGLGVLQLVREEMCVCSLADVTCLSVCLLGGPGGSALDLRYFFVMMSSGLSFS